jgi:hypothetical protein
MTVADLYRQLDGLISRFPLAPGRELHYIDYAHRDGDVFYHGTVSDLDGVPRSTWTYEDSGQLVTRDQPIDSETFSQLWGALVQLPVFRRAITNDMGSEINPDVQHIVGIIFTEGLHLGRCVLLVPVDEPDPALAAWLGFLNVPGQRPSTREEGQVKVFLTPLAMLLAAREQQKGAPLTREEVLAVRDRALCTMMTQAQADTFHAFLDSQAPVPRIDPERCWEEWQAIRQQIGWTEHT